jgi:trans-aconitate 2-methyltransferase
MKNSKEIQDYYNDYAEKQKKTGINLRHYYLFNKIIGCGLKKNHKVLEVGCGIGTFTSLLHRYLKHGKLVATDISNKSVEIAKNNIKNSESIVFITSDMSDFTYPEKFDFLILPDVLEHIQIEKHTRLFENLAALMHEDSLMIINIPHPKVIEYLREYYPEKLQVIDQPIYSDNLLINTYSNELHLVSYESYSLFHNEQDYAFIIFKKNNPVTFSEISKYSIIIKKLINRIKYIISTI